jgi:hypothetical protein
MLRFQRTTKQFIDLAAILILLTVACSREEQFIGTYKSISGSSPEFADLYFELKKGGEGIRRINGKDLSFKWVSRGHRIRIHPHSGGTIEGHIWGNFLVLKFPGPQVIYLRKVK